MASLPPRIAISYSTTRGSCLKINSFNCMLSRALGLPIKQRESLNSCCSEESLAVINRLNFSTSTPTPLYHRPTSAHCPKTVPF